MHRNVFGGTRLYASHTHDAFFRADKRWTVTITTKDAAGNVVANPSNLQNLWDGDYESFVVVPAGHTMTVSMTFPNELNGQFPGYPYGTVFISHYYDKFSESQTLRGYSNYAAHGIGWHEQPFSTHISNGVSSLITKAYMNKYQISEYQFVITAKATNDAWICAIEMNLDRVSGTNELPYFDKYQPQKVYYDTTYNAAGTGPVVKSPDGSRWRLTVSNTGTITATKL